MSQADIPRAPTVPANMAQLEAFIKARASEDNNLLASTYLGETTINPGGFMLEEDHVSIIFRTIFPAGNESRHAIINMFPSVSEATLAAELRRVFDLEAQNGWIMKTEVHFTAPTSIEGVGTRPSSRDILAKVGKEKNGIFELTVKSQADFKACDRCKRPISAMGTQLLEAMKSKCFEIVKRPCLGCYGVPAGEEKEFVLGTTDVNGTHIYKADDE